jgi:hypothetical protein
MKHFPLVRLGNKQNDIKYFKQYLPDKKDITTVAECFAGSFAVIRNCFYDVDNIVCADNDLEFRERCTNVFNHLDEFKNEKILINKLIKEKKEQGHKYLYTGDDEFKNVKNDIKYIDMDTIHNRGCIKPLTTTIDYNDVKQLYYKIKWYDDFKQVFELYKNDEKAFLFLDPPYFCSSNKVYLGDKEKDKRKIIDNTGIYIEIYEFMKVAKCKIMLIVNKSKIIEYIFKDYYKDKYNKTYQSCKNNEDLNIYCNY